MVDDKRIRLEFGREEYYFYFLTAEGDAVAEESREIAANHKQRPESAAIQNCRYRIEFYGEDDQNMDYFNDFFGLMEEVKKIRGTIIFDYPNARFFGDT